MSTVQAHKKTVAARRKQAAKKAKPKKGSIEAIEEAARLIKKYNLDFSCLKQ